MESFTSDLRQGLRLVFKNPGFSAAAILTLALGIGANTSVFSVVNGVLIKPLPYPEPEKLIRLYESNIQRGWPTFAFSPANFKDWRAQSESFETMAAYGGRSVTLTGEGEAMRVTATVATSELLPLLGAEPIQGRVFSAAEDSPGQGQVVVLSESFWRSVLGADPDAVGRSLTLNGDPYDVIGILPESFKYPSAATQLWMPLAMGAEGWSNRGGHFLAAIGRLSDGYDLSAARAEMQTIAERLSAEYPRTNEGWGAALTPLHRQVVGNVRNAVLILWASVGFVTLIACANVANLLLSRSESRRKEFAVRSALGAGRLRLLRQILTESSVLALLGGAAGLLLAYLGLQGLLALGRGIIPRINQVSLDAGVMGFTLTLTLLSGLLFGLLPALRSRRVNLNVALRDAGRRSSGWGRGRIRGILVAGEVSLALVLLICAGLLIRSFIHLVQIDPGYKADGLLSFRMSLPRAGYPGHPQRMEFYRQLHERLQEQPDVRSVGASMALPMLSDYWLSYEVVGMESERPEDRTSASYRAVFPGYFRTLGTPLKKGRSFDWRDAAEAEKVAVVNEAFVQRHFADRDPLGEQLSIGNGVDEPFRIVGVVGNVKQVSLEGESPAGVYVPMAQHPFRSMSFVVRSDSDSEALVPSIRELVRSMDAELPIYSVQPMAQTLSESLSPQRFNLLLLGAFAFAALILSLIGIYGVLSYTVSQRTHEIGVLMALGARASDVLGLVLGQGMRMTGLGIAVGLLAAFGLTRFLSSMLFEVSAFDASLYGLVAGLLALTALAACYLPARRACRVDPLSALRVD